MTLQLVLGLVAVAVSVVAWGVFVAATLKQIKIIRLGQPDGTLFGPFVPRLKTMIVEFVAHTRMAKFRSVAPWHWMVMRGFLIGSAMAGSANMPILTASTAISEKIASICAATISGGIGKTRVTPVVFCAVSAVTTAIP